MNRKHQVFERLHKWLIKLVVGRKPVIANVHFLEGMKLATEHLEKDTLTVNCFVHEAIQTAAGVRRGGVVAYLDQQGL